MEGQGQGIFRVRVTANPGAGQSAGLPEPLAAWLAVFFMASMRRLLPYANFPVVTGFFLPYAVSRIIKRSFVYMWSANDGSLQNFIDGRNEMLGNRYGRMRSMLAIACLSLALAAPGLSNAVQIADVNIDDTAAVARQQLQLNGAGIRYKVIFQVYAAGLYLAEQKTRTADVLALPGARRVHLVMMRDLTNEQLGQSFMAGMKKNSTLAERTRIVNQMTDFGELFASIPLLKKGDVLDTDWIPGSGTFCYLNGKKIAGPIPDIAFYNALLKIWIGDNPADAQLKLNLLGEKFSGH